MMNRYEQIIKDVEEQFSEPKYLEHKIHYVSNKHTAEICISARHTMGDYLLVGIRALQRSINDIPGDILVFNDPAPDTEIIGIPAGRHTPLRKIVATPSIFRQAHKSAEEIYRCLYKGNNPAYGIIGSNISLGLTLEFSEAGNGIPKEIMSELQFTHFDDVRTAEENAFILITSMAITDVTYIWY